jgi:hypothetical protein
VSFPTTGEGRRIDKAETRATIRGVLDQVWPMPGTAKPKGHVIPSDNLADNVSRRVLIGA